MYGCKSWTIKKNEHQRIDIFELWCWRRLLRVSWTARRSNQSIPKEINPEYSLEGLMLKQELQDSGHLMWRAYSLEKTLTLRKIEGKRGSRWQRLRVLDGITRLSGHEFGQTLGDSEGQGNLVCCSQWGCKESERLSDWTTTTTRIITGMKFLPRFEQCQKYPLQMVSSSNTFFLKERTHTREEMKTRTLADGSWEAWEEETRILVLFWLQGPWGSQNPSFYSVSSSAWCPRTLMTPWATSVPVMYLFWSSELTGLSPYNPL